jgi:hypothetical protein
VAGAGASGAKATGGESGASAAGVGEAGAGDGVRVLNFPPSRPPRCGHPQSPRRSISPPGLPQPPPRAELERELEGLAEQG